jgi:hypothetical protein
MIDDLLHDYGPDGRIAEPVPVTCTTTVARNLLEQWVATLVISWEAGEGYAAGRWGSYISFDTNGDPAGSSGVLEVPGGFAYPGTIGELPAPLDGPFEIPIGSIVEVLPPGILQTKAPIQAMYADPHPTIGDGLAIDAQPGARYGVVSGPISHAGYDWYQVEWQNGTSYPSEVPWIPSSDGVRPLVRIIEPDCPDDPSVLDLVGLEPLERVRCYGDHDITLDSAIAILAADEGDLGSVDGEPAWLAKYSLWRLYGPDGPDGLDGALPIAIDPSLGDSIRTGTPIRVIGHFDDPASATCRRTVPEEWGWQESPEIQRLRCRELFVVTGTETRGAP